MSDAVEFEKEPVLRSDRWFALSIGNSRLHWAEFMGNDLQHTWTTPHLTEIEVQHHIATQFSETRPPSTEPQRNRTLPLTPHPSLLTPHPLWIASVVPQQSQLWTQYPAASFTMLSHIPLKGMYPTFGVDRALAIWGAINTVGSPVLVIDAGTALTFTGANATHQLIGGAILPGLGLQFQTLKQATATLPDVTEGFTPQHVLPPRWALTTAEAIASGIIYTVLAGLQNFVTAWWQQFPGSAVMLRGGDSDRLYAYLAAFAPDLANNITVEPRLIFWGLRSVRRERMRDEGW